MTKQFHSAFLAVQNTQDSLNQRGFTATIRSDNTDKLSFLDGQVHVVDDSGSTTLNGQALNGEKGWFVRGYREDFAHFNRPLHEPFV